MGERFWFAGRLSESMTTVYLFSAPSRRFAMDVMLEFCKSPVVEQLTWSRLSWITGCVKPADADLNSFAIGHVIIHRQEKMDLVLLPI